MPCSDGGRESASPVSSACSRVSFEALSFPACPVRMDASPEAYSAGVCMHFRETILCPFP
mgnify:CR=1 FL=1